MSEESLPPIPTVKSGFIFGVCRLETNGPNNQDAYSNVFANRWLKEQGPIDLDTNDGIETFGITHLQKKSRFGFLVMRPFCFHVWFTFRFQKQDADGSWMRGSEKVLYFRVGRMRWDAGDGKYIKGENIKIGSWQFRVPFGTWYGPGLHWD